MRAPVYKLLVSVIFVCAGGSAQKPEFDLASIRPAAPGAHGMRCSGGPGTSDPGLFTCENCNLSTLVMMAYEVRAFQLAAPAWMQAARFNVSARIPPNADQRQFELMQQELLRQRFGLKTHFEKKQMAVYELAVSKDGHKGLKTSELQVQEKPPSLWVPAASGPPVRTRAHVTRKSTPTSDLAKFLSDQLNTLVIDATGLAGRYDYELTFVMDPGGRAAGPSPGDDADFGSSLIDAVRDQLGLKLEKKRGQADVLVVDSAEKIPSSN
jgi:uncharacterized protein (TIGR03435 family)